MQPNPDFFVIPRHLDNIKTIAGLPRMEILPGLLIFITSLLFHHELIGLGLAILWFFSFRMIKIGYGQYWLAIIIYIYLPVSLSKLIYRSFPPAYYHYWLW